MNCHLCPQKFVIQTDPEHNDFKCVSGLHRKAQVEIHNCCSIFYHYLSIVKSN
jgi:hypothetical protein